MLSGGYSNRFQQLDVNHAEHIRHIHQTERVDMIARNKKLQQETNRRRKALAIKRKLESQREEKRRQEILNKRREEQHRATEKYQRLNKHYTPSKEDEETNLEPDPFTPPPESPRRTPVLEDALKAIRGTSARRGGGGGGHQDAYNRQNSTDSVKSGSTNTSKPARIGSASSTGGASTVSSATSHGPPPGTFYGSDALNRAYYNKYGAGSPNLNARTAEHARQIAVHTELQTTSLRNLNNSRSLFEAQLEQHQHQLADHQRQALNQFNAAIRQEIDQDATLQGTEDIEPEIVRSNSVSSLDSLEEEQVSDRASHLKSNSESQLENQVPGNNSVVRHTSALTQPNYLHTSQSDSCLQKYGQNQADQNEQEQLKKRSNEAPDNYEMRNHSTGVSVVSPPPNPGLMLHRNLSGNSNVAVVQPISSASKQTPSNVYHNTSHNKAPVASVQPGVNNYNTSSPPVTNGFYSQAIGDHGKNQGTITSHVPATGQGKDVNVIGPISSTNMGRNGNQYHVDQFNNPSVPNSSKSFYLGAQSGTNYTVGHVTAHPDNRTLNDADFHARTKAWTTPTPDILSPKGDTTQGAGSNAAGINNFTTNVKPNSTRLTATHTTLTTDSPSIPANFQNQATMGNGSTGHNRPQSGVAGYQQNGGTIHYGTYGQGAASNVHQNGVVYSKGSIPSTAIVNMNDMHNYQVNNNPSMQGPSSLIDTASIPLEGQSARDEGSAGESSAEEEDDDLPTERVLKGILKRPYSIPNQQSSGRGRGVRGRGYSSMYYSGGRGRGHPPLPTGPGARDSIEIAREQRGDTEKPEKKSVRFAENLVEEQGVTPRMVENREPESSFVKPTLNSAKVTKKIPVRVKGRPPRPVSAKVASTSPKNPAGRESRVASAGSLRKGPFVRQPAKVTVNKAQTVHNNDSNSVRFRSGGTTATSTTTPSYPSSSTTGGGTTADNASANRTNPMHGPVKSNMEPVYDGNGLRLDRTPTDDEINWLWDKVRTCLSRNSAVQSSQDTQTQATDQASVVGRQAAQMSSKYIDGNSLAPQFRAATRVTPNGNSMANEKEVTINGTGYAAGHKKKITMDHLNSYSRKNSSLLAQRKNTAQAHAVSSTPATTTHTTTYQTTNFSNALGPQFSSTTPHNGEVSESMAAFLAAEALVQQSQSVTESHIEDAMEVAKQNQRTHNSSKPQHKVPTALSMEEQRLLQSLERLNERLKSHVQMTRPPSMFGRSSSSSHRGTKKHAENREVYVYENWTEGDQTKSGYRLTETSVAGGTSNYVPRSAQYETMSDPGGALHNRYPYRLPIIPPAKCDQGRGFRGHQPLTSTQRRYHSANPTTSENRQLFRATSATNTPANYGGHVAYH